MFIANEITSNHTPESDPAILNILLIDKQILA